jgi:hypothetical protein
MYTGAARRHITKGGNYALDDPFYDLDIWPGEQLHDWLIYSCTDVIATVVVSIRNIQGRRPF